MNSAAYNAALSVGADGRRWARGTHMILRLAGTVTLLRPYCVPLGALPVAASGYGAGEAT